MASSEDEALIDDFRDGDPDAFRSLFDRFAPQLEARIRRRLDPGMRRRISIADVLQDARIAAFGARETFENRGLTGFRNWLFGIVEHRVLRARERHLTDKRNVRFEVTRGLRADTAAVPGCRPSPSQLAIARELRERTRAAIDALPEPYREVVRLTHGEHLDLHTVAARLGKSYDATRKLHARALLRLAAVLRPAEDGNGG